MLSRPSTPADPRPLKARIADTLRERIAGGRLALGARLSDKDLAQELRVSRTPVREALLQLANERLVVMHPQRGTYVFALEGEALRELCELRGVLEAGAARLLAARGAKAAAAVLAGIAADSRKALARRDGPLCEALDTQFHETLVANGGNALLAESYRALSDRVRAVRRRLPASRERVARGIAEHEAIARALAKGDGEAAAALLVRHVDNVRRLAAAGRPEPALRD